MRWGSGVTAIIGESFAEIFYGNCLAMGVPCPTVDDATIGALMSAVEKDPALDVSVDLETRTIVAGSETYSFSMPDGPRQQLMSGRWDTTTELLANRDAIQNAASRIPYFRNYE
jgi:3-isopropylmalate/(R)-2-methylmalate dehydratase small subunit